MKRWLPYLGLALGVALVVYALFFVKTEEERLRERLDALEAAVAIDDARETPLVRDARLRKRFAEIFTKDVALAVPELGATDKGRTALADLAISAQHRLARTSLDLDDLAIRLDESKQHALAVGIAHLVGTEADGTLIRDDRTVSLRLDVIEGEWRIVDVSVSPPTDDSLPTNEGVAPLRRPSNE
ncbi:MAG: nuclear transport factor 2 family protein [Deltaproteobacteria bacterium]|nr:nuclear transport factor 2 family protein [Deltaproteobacteria bacterium]